MIYTMKCDCGTRQCVNDPEEFECKTCGSHIADIEGILFTREDDKEKVIKIFKDELQRRKDNQPIIINFQWKDNGHITALSILSLEEIQNILLSFTETKDIMPFGKYKGKPIADMPSSYIAWLFKNTDLKNPLKEKLENLIWEREKSKFIEDFIDRNLQTRQYSKNYSYSPKKYYSNDYVDEWYADAMDGCMPNQ